MAIDVALLKYYPPTNSDGGEIVTTAVIPDNELNNIFDDITDTERVEGHTDYRKIFFRNENTDSFTFPKVYIQSNTPCTTDTIYIALGASNDTTTAATGLTYVQPTSAVHADVLEPSTLAQNESFSIWIKRVVDSGSGGYNNNTFTLTVEQGSS